MDAFYVLSCLMIATWLGIAVYNVRQGGTLWFYKWYSREEAPLKFWFSIVAYGTASAGVAWIMFAALKS
jgi:hypothetical protein